jgi:hypothetical protein
MPSPKLTQEKADEIRRRFFVDRALGKVIAHEFGVSKSTVSEIVRDKIWKGATSRKTTTETFDTSAACQTI